MKHKTWSVSSVSNLLVVVAIVVVVNLIGLRLFTRADLTENHVYTLSRASRNVVAGLEDRLTVKAYFTKDLPPPYNANSRYVNDVLSDYRAYSHGKFIFEFVDPSDETELEAEARRYGIQPQQRNSMRRDKVELRLVYAGLVLIYGDKRETIPFVESVDGLEYQITTAVKRLVGGDLPKVGFLGGLGTPDPGGREMRTVTWALSPMYRVVPVNPGQGNSLIDEDVDVLCIVQPKEALDDWTRFCIDQYIMHGGKVGWFLNKVKADMQTSQATGLQLNLDDLTRSYGFVVGNNLVTDLNASMVNVQQQQGIFMVTNAVRYPAFPRITDINRQMPMVKDLQELTLFYPSSVDTVRSGRSNVTFMPLFQSSEHTRVQQGRFDINPMAQARKEDFSGGRKLLGLAITGDFASAFQGKSVPLPKDSTAAIPQITIIEHSPQTRMVVIGDGNFVQGQFAQGGPNEALFLNAVDWLYGDLDLISVRSRQVETRPLKDNITDATKRTVKYANMFGPPVLVLALGLVRWTMRRNRHKGVVV